MKISVLVTSYNHEKYISQCLESVLCQKGDFQMEVIVGDDSSTDNTLSIARQFQERTPEIITLLPPQPNLGVTKNLKRCLEACSGDYIAICEGDDYWTDEYKLQKQMEHLELHPDYSMCFSALMVYFEDTKTFVPNVAPDADHINTEALIGRNYIANLSCCMFRASVVKKLPSGIFDLYIADWMFNITCSQFGDIGYIRDWMSVYRKHSGGAWSHMSALENLHETCRLIDIYNRFFDYKYDAFFQRTRGIIEGQIGYLNANHEPEAGTDTNLLAAAQELKEIKQSLTWRLAKRIRQLFPDGSRREKWVRALIRAIQSVKQSMKNN